MKLSIFVAVVLASAAACNAALAQTKAETRIKIYSSVSLLN
jgi:hypothetical protein